MDEPLIVRKSWGKNSRCKTSKYIFLSKIEQCKQQLLEKQLQEPQNEEQTEKPLSTDNEQVQE